MYVIDVTRSNGLTDMMCGNDSMDAKNKTLNYIIDYAMANHELYIDRDILDQNLNIESFSLKKFLNENYSSDIDKDLLIQSIATDKDKCLFVKFQDDKTAIPELYIFNKKEEDIAHNVLTFLVNDSLIHKYQDNLSVYENKKLDYNNKTFGITNFKDNIKCDIVSLYDHRGMFLEELLNNACTLNDIKYKDYGGIEI